MINFSRNNQTFKNFHLSYFAGKVIFIEKKILKVNFSAECQQKVLLAKSAKLYIFYKVAPIL